MIVIHVTYDDIYGAGKAACRISNAERKIGIDSTVCVFNKSVSSSSKKIFPTRRERVENRISIFLNKRRNNSQINADRYGCIYNQLYEEIKKSDIVHLHWINAGIWSDAFAKMIKKLDKPVVWTMHDMWPFTGGCHYNEKCDGYLTGCKKCSKLNDRYVEYALKQKIKFYNENNIVFVGCSNWIVEELKKSYISQKQNVNAMCIHNPITNKFYRPIEKRIARNLLGIQSKKRMILFGAATSFEIRKGYRYLKDAVSGLDREKYCIGFFGGEIPEGDFVEFDKFSFGYILDEVHMSLIYNCADVFVAPSIQENLSNAVLEALSCGVPVVAFNIGGMPDMIVNKVNGMLTTPFSVEELTNNIQEAFELDGEKISNSIGEFAEEIIGKQYLDVYNKMLQ